MILIIEDNPLMREALSAMLAEEGYSVVSAQDGREAQELLAHPALLPDLILFDLMMPRMDGWAFRTWQCSQPTLAAIPVILLSSTTDLHRHANELRATAFFTKPVVVSQLLATVAQVLQMYSGTPQLS